MLKTLQVAGNELISTKNTITKVKMSIEAECCVCKKEGKGFHKEKIFSMKSEDNLMISCSLTNISASNMTSYANTMFNVVQSAAMVLENPAIIKLSEIMNL